MADEAPRKGSLTALVGHTNGLTKPAALAAAAVSAKPGGGGGSKKLVIKNFRGGCGPGAEGPGRRAGRAGSSGGSEAPAARWLTAPRAPHRPRPGAGSREADTASPAPTDSSQL